MADMITHIMASCPHSTAQLGAQNGKYMVYYVWHDRILLAGIISNLLSIADPGGPRGP